MELSGIGNMASSTPCIPSGDAMPLLDHFHPPLSDRRHWESFHARWISSIADHLNRALPNEYYAESQVHAGARFEVDVATFLDDSDAGGGLATMTRTQVALSAPTLVLPAIFPPEFAVNVFETSGGPNLVAAIELVSPANKDRPESRQAFAVKCAAYLRRGMGVIVVDVVTSRKGRPLDDLLALLHPTIPAIQAGDLTAVSYRPIRVGDLETIELRASALAVGSHLPNLPLGLNSGLTLPVDFEICYEEAREGCRL